MKVYGSAAALVAILILATPGAYSFDASQSWGDTSPGDIMESVEISKNGKFLRVQKYAADIKMTKKITSIKFWDKEKNGGTIWITRQPPCYFTSFRIASARGKGFRFVLEVYHES